MFRSYCAPENRRLALRIDIGTCLAAAIYVVVAAGLHGAWKFAAMGLLLVLVASVMVGIGLFLMEWLGEFDFVFTLPGFLLCLSSMVVATVGAFGDVAGQTIGVWRLVAGAALMYLYFELVNIPINIFVHYEQKHR